LALVSRAVRGWTESPPAGWIAAASLGVSTTFWAQATTANVRMLTAFAVALALAALADYQRAVAARRGLGRPKRAPFQWAVLALGVAVSHHGSTVFLAAVLAVYALSLDWRVVRRPELALIGALPFLLWLYFPLRAGAFGSPPNAQTWDGFLDQILARGWSGDMLAFATPAALPERLRVLGVILGFQWNGWLLGLMALGALALVYRQRRLGAALLTGWGAHVFIAITYRAPQTTEYLLPAYVLMAAAAGFAAAELLRPPWPARWPARAARLGALGITAAGLAGQLWVTYPAYRALARDDSTRAAAMAMLEAAPADALLLANWHWATPLWYLQQIEGRRPDVDVQYVVPQGLTYAQNWLDAIAAAWRAPGAESSPSEQGPARPVLVTNFFKVEFAASGLRFLPSGPIWEARAGPVLTPPAGLHGARAFAGLEFLGYTPTAPLTVVAAWRAAGPPRDLNFYVHLVGPDGLLYGQHDVSVPASRYAAGEVLSERYALTPLREAPPGTYTLTAGAYTPAGQRLAEVTLTTLTLPAAAAPAPTTHPGVWRVGGAWLTGYDVDRSLPDSQRLYAHWQLGPAAAVVRTPDGLAADLPAGPGAVTTVVEWPADQPLPAPFAAAPSPARYVPLGDALILTWAAAAPRTARPGETVAVDLEFLAARPITRDLTVKVELTGAGWRAQRDTTPVDGGLPTLKWITGARVRDRYWLTVPAEAGPGPAQLSLGWYDAFTQADLPILDPRLAQLGPTVPLGQIEITDP
ncbi:MAG: hypothetical protein KA764_09250, partial [Anaerolineales bacterium]|nr:hypothetical protein [Anaerolineales bacterium]